MCCGLIEWGLEDRIALAKYITRNAWSMCGDGQLSSSGHNMPDDISTSHGTMVSPEIITNAEVLRGQSKVAVTKIKI